jgi:hypothetical protein
MKKQACKKVADALLLCLSGYTYEIKPNALFQVPVDDVFRGIIFDSSGFSSEAFYPEVFVLPLCIPTDRFTLTFGKRLSGRWDYVRGQEEILASRLFESMEREGAFRLLNDLSTPEKFVQNLSKYHSNPNDPYFQRAIAYSFAACGDFGQAIWQLDKCRSTLQNMQREQPDIRWYAPFLDEVTRFRELAVSNPADATKQLSEWTEYTRSKLHLAE